MTNVRAGRVAIIGGGMNDEHEVSLASAAAITRAIRALELVAVPLTIGRDGVWRDERGALLTATEAVRMLTSCSIAYPTLHGVNGEDGAVAGFCELIGLRYVGSPVSASAFGMDKHVTKLIAHSAGIATARDHVLGLADSTESIAPDFAAPYVVKPATAGSSNGVAVVSDRARLAGAVRAAREFGDTVLVEEYVQGREIDIAVFRGEDGCLRISVPLEIGVVPGGVFDRDEKYDGSATFTVPARLNGGQLAALRRAAKMLYQSMGCSGVARFDFFVGTDGVVLNEVNTAPGMTEHSQVPRMFGAMGLSYAELISALLAAEFARVPISDGEK